MRSELDQYLILKPAGTLEDTSKELLPYLETVRRTSEWKRLGFRVELDEYGFPVRGGGDEYEFWVAREREEVIADAIRTGKKALRHPVAVFSYVRAGCELSEFANLPEDVAAYCTGNMLRLTRRLEEALPHLQRAITLNPREVRYFEAYYPVRLALGDLSAIREELEFYRNDMDSAVHSGRFDEWIGLAIGTQDFLLAKDVISAARTALQNLVDGRAVARLYGRQKPAWYEYKKEQFEKKAKKYLERIAKLESKK